MRKFDCNNHPDFSPTGKEEAKRKERKRMRYETGRYTHRLMMEKKTNLDVFAFHNLTVQSTEKDATNFFEKMKTASSA